MGYAIVTLMGINQMYEALHGDNIFNDITLPTGLDKSVLINRIMWRCHEFSVGHTDPEFMHFEIINFFKVHYREFEKMVELSELEYNPIENYDRQETWRDDGTFQTNTSMSSEGETTTSNTNRTTNLKTDVDTTNTNTVAAFNSSSYEPHDKSVTSGSNTTNGTITDTGTGTHEDSTTGNENGTNANVHSGRVHGNIGVTTTQQMIQSSLELEPMLNIYNYISDLFADEMVIQVY